MYEPEELRWGVYEIFAAFESIEYPPRASFLKLAPEVDAGRFEEEASRCLARFAPFYKSTSLARRDRTVYLRSWRAKNREKWNAYRREWRRKRAA